MSNGVAAAWQLISEYIEPDWASSTNFPPTLFWRKGKGPVLGFIRDGELFDTKSVYVCDANRVTHFSEVVAPV